MLAQVAGTLQQRKVKLVFAQVSDHVRRQLDMSGVTDVVGRDAYFLDLAKAAKAFATAQPRRQFGDEAAQPWIRASLPGTHSSG